MSHHLDVVLCSIAPGETTERRDVLSIETGELRIGIKTLLSLVAVVATLCTGGVTVAMTFVTQAEFDEHAKTPHPSAVTYDVLRKAFSEHQQRPHTLADGAPVSAPASLVTDVRANADDVAALSRSVAVIVERLDESNRKLDSLLKYERRRGTR